MNLWIKSTLHEGPRIKSTLHNLQLHKDTSILGKINQKKRIPIIQKISKY